MYKSTGAVYRLSASLQLCMQHCWLWRTEALAHHDGAPVRPTVVAKSLETLWFSATSLCNK